MTVEKYWRTVLYVPSNTPSMIQKCDIYGADAVTLDLEDSVGPGKKNQARYLVKNAIQTLDFSSDLMIRINSIASGLWEEDLKMMDITKLSAIRVPMVESSDEIIKLSDYLDNRENEVGLTSPRVLLLVGIETALGYLNREKIINCNQRVVGIGFGSEDFITDTGVSRENLKYVKLELALCAKGYGKCFIDSVFPDFSNPDAFKYECEEAKSKIANAVFSPGDEEIKVAREIVAQAEKLKTGDAFNYKGQMVDKPILDRCLQILKYGERNG